MFYLVYPPRGSVEPIHILGTVTDETGVETTLYRHEHGDFVLCMEKVEEHSKHGVRYGVYKGLPDHHLYVFGSEEDVQVYLDRRHKWGRAG